MFALFLVVVFSVFGSMNWLIARTIAMQFPNHKLLIYMIVILFALTSVISMVLRDLSILNFIGTIGHYWIAVSFLGLVVYGIFALIPKDTFWLSTAILVLLLGIGIYTAQSLKQTDYQIKLAKDTENMRIALISDTHLGYVNGAKKLETIVDRVNATNPDVILIAGDLFDSSVNTIYNLEGVREALNNFKSTYGTYLAWGNHDAGNTFQEMKEIIDQTDIVLLEDEYIDVGPFVVIGRRDIQPIGEQGGERLPMDDVVQDADLTKPVFVIDHQPSEVNEYEDYVDLIVSGHTHHGQIFPFNYITNAIFPIDYGIMQKENGTYAIVTSGAGFWGPPIRLGTKSEFVIIEVE